MGNVDLWFEIFEKKVIFESVYAFVDPLT